MSTFYFSDQTIKTLKPEAKRVEFYDDHLIKGGKLKMSGAKGLGLRVSPGGTKTFFYTYWHGGKSHRITIGTYPNISLSYAREQAGKYAETVSEGKNPGRIRRAAKSDTPITLKEYAERFESEYVARKLKPSTQRDYKSRLNRIKGFKKLANMPLIDIQREQIRSYLKTIAVDNPINANRIHSILSKLFNEAQEDQVIPENPIKGMVKVSKEHARDVRYGKDNIKEIWNALEQEHTSMKSLIRILLLTGQRLGETSRMKWVDIDLETKIWTIPKAETKSNRPHIVPLSETATEMLLQMREAYPESEYVFPGFSKTQKPWSDFKGVTKRIRKAVNLPEFRIHDLRHIVATGMIELGIEFIHVGKVLNHKSLAGENVITSKYTNNEFTDQKRSALEIWSQYVMRLVYDRKSKVVGRIGARLM